jgi:hypothetical protein
VWIGPRHTYADGSICAYERQDLTWTREMGPQPLLDLISLWVARQIYLRAYGRWPGMQRVHTPLERILVQNATELCGGCASGKTYARCCYRKDLLAVSAAELRRAESSGIFDRRRIALPSFD